MASETFNTYDPQYRDSNYPTHIHQQNSHRISVCCSLFFIFAN